jgi:uncharacterized protein YlaN (UPF0358 family)
MVKQLAAIIVVAGLASLAFGQFGQKKSKEPAEKAVSGIVTDAAGNPAQGAVVQLKNLRTLQVRSFIAKEMGDYYFYGLSTDVDYEIKAEFNGKSSATRTLSSFDTRAEAKVDLQVK